MKPTISIIIPTAGSDTLPYCLQTISQQELIEGDEILVIGDGQQKEVEAQVEAIGEPFRYIEGEHTNDWGHHQINQGIGLARGKWIMFTDDDDGYLPRAIETVRRVVEAKGEVPHLFRFFTNDHHLVWRGRDDGRIDETLVGGHNVVLPNHKVWKDHASWTSRYRGDLDFIRAVLDSYPRRSWAWQPEILTRQRPDRVLAWWSVKTDEQFEELRKLRNDCREIMTRDREEITPARQREFVNSVRTGERQAWPFLFSLREAEPFEYIGYMLLRRDSSIQTTWKVPANRMLVSYGLGTEHRGKGLARPIFQFALDACMEDAYAEVLESNSASLHVHKELGWISRESKDGIQYLWHQYPPI